MAKRPAPRPAVPPADPCPYCGHEHPWDNDTDSYPTAKVVSIKVGTHTSPAVIHDDRRVALYCCKACDAVIGVVVVESAGSTLYIPPGDEWNNAHGY